MPANTKVMQTMDQKQNGFCARENVCLVSHLPVVICPVQIATNPQMAEITPIPIKRYPKGLLLSFGDSILRSDTKRLSR